jgi:Xaa-Pro dipeptidase
MWSMEIRKDLAFTADEFKRRCDRVCAEISRRGLDALVIHTPENICYLSGFNTPGYYYPQILILVPGRDPVIILRALEGLGVDAHCWFNTDSRVTYADNENPMTAVADVIKELRLVGKRLGIEMHGWFLPIGRFRELEVLLPTVRFADGSWIVEEERKIKSPAEIEYIRRACRIAEMGMETAVRHCRAGVTENEVAGEVHKTMVSAGCEYTGLPAFLVSGHRALVSHAIWSDKVIERGDNIYAEFAGTVKRYAGPLFRTLVVGNPSASMARNARTAALMLDAAMMAIKPGIQSHEVSRAVTEAASVGGASVFKRPGYSVGINFAPDWGEGIFLELKDGDQTVIRPGMVFHLPQSVRVPGEAPVAISETVLVTESGIDVLTNFKRELLQV